MKVLLVQPDWRQENFGFRLAAMPEPLGLETLAAALPDHDVRIADQRCGDDVAETVRSFQPDLVGVTALTPEVYAALEVLRQVKEIAPEVMTVAGGHHASLLPQDFACPQVDAVVLGEGEPVLAGLVEALQCGRDLSTVANLIYRDADGRFRATPRRVPRINLDTSPLPRRDLVERHRHKYFFLFDQSDTSMSTGRGCPYRCSFCSVWEFYAGQTRAMSAERVVAELKTLRTPHVTFIDDNFLLNHRRERRIADLIQAEGLGRRFSMECRTDSIVRHPDVVAKWVDIGLYAVLLGLEGSDATLTSINKKNNVRTNDQAIRILQDHGVIIWGAFLVDPDWSGDDFQRLREYVSLRGITHTQFTVLTPLPGTELWRRNQDQLLTRDYTCFDALHAVVPTRLPREEFYRHLADLYRQTDLGPYYELVRAGKLTLQDIQRGKEVLSAMSRWENYAANDPVLREGPQSRYIGFGDPARARLAPRTARAPMVRES